MKSSFACWKLYGEVLSREYSGIKHNEVHRLTVDAYALQHTGDNLYDRHAIQSVNFHLVLLYSIFKHKLPHNIVTKWLGKRGSK